MRRRAAAVAALILLLPLGGCYSGKGTEGTEGAPSGNAPANTNAPAAAVSAAPAPSSLGSVRYSFTQHYTDGTINSDAPAQTPNHRGALVLPVVIDGVPSSALTVLATYRYSYDVKVPANSVLAFQAAKPFNIGIASFGFVDVDADGKTTRLFGDQLQPSDANGLKWHRFSAPLDQYAGKKIRVTFGANMVDGNGIASWVTFANAGIYAKGGSTGAAAKRS